MRILVVDDEIVSRMKMQKILEGLGDVHCAENGPDAIGAFKRAWEGGDPFQLIVLDISMPGMDGTEVLLEIKEYEQTAQAPAHKQAKVLMVTSQCDRNSVVTCVQAGCDGYMVKPFNREAVFEKLRKLGGDIARALGDEAERSMLQAAIEDLIADFQEGNAVLPALPGVVNQIEQKLTTPNATVQDVAALIERDPIITARVIAVANSPLFRGTSPIRTVANAIPRLGMRGTQTVVSAIASHNFYEQTPQELRNTADQLWRHSLACASAGRILAAMIRYRDVERIFLMGMLHDIGKIILLNGLAPVVAESPAADLAEVLALVHLKHNEFGGLVLESWQFPAEFAAMAREHDARDWEPAAARTTLIVALANALTREHAYSLFEARGEDLAASAPAQILGVTADMLAETGRRLAEQMNSEGFGLAAA